MLHDVGKMRISPEVLNKPGALDADEWRLMQRHPEYGSDLLGSEHELEPDVREAALSHHERLDGKGYPNALTGPAISQLTRMVSITYSIRKALPDGVPGFSLADHIRHQGGQHPGMPSSSTPERR